MSLGRNIRFVGHQIYHVPGAEMGNLPKIDNVIFKTDNTNLKWLEESTFKVGEWRDITRSTYIRWALAINGLFVAGEKYKDETWKSKHQFSVTSYRVHNEGPPSNRTIAVWSGDVASKAHFDSISMIVSYGVVDLYGCFEELIFDFYRTYLNHNPGAFIIGRENKSLRKLYNDRLNNAARWSEAWKSRLDKWQRKKLYDGLDQVFLSFINTAGLEKPNDYSHTDPITWAETIREIAMLRNCLTHGEKYIPEELSILSKKAHGLGFHFEIGEEIKLTVHHLKCIELFADQLLTALNLSLIERGEKDLH